MLAAIKYCEVNKRTLIVDWTDAQFDVEGENAFSKCFHVTSSVKCGLINAMDKWDSLSHSSELFKQYRKKGIYDLYIEKQTSFFNSLPISFFPKGKLRTLRRRWQPKVAGYNSLCFGSDLKDNLKEDVIYFMDFLPDISYDNMPYHINLLPEIKSEIAEFRSKNNLSTAIGVHVRYTDKKPSQQVSVLIEHLKKKKEKSIFLCTDSTYIEELFAKKFKNIILYPKIKPQLSGEGLHQWALYKNQDKLKHVIYKQSVLEMFLLSECNELFYQGNSTFSNISKTYHNNKKNCFDWQKI